MGVIRGGILGGFRKKAGAVVGSYWRTLDVIRGLPRISGKAPTQLQLDQQLKFRLVTTFLSSFSDLIDVGFKPSSSVATPMNMAVSYNLKVAITGTGPDFELDYTKISFSEGSLPLPLELKAESLPDAEVKFSWPAEKDSPKISGTDMVNLMLYNPDKERFVTLLNAAVRDDAEYTVQLPANFSGDMVHCYLSLNSKNKLQVSRTSYLGMQTVM